MRLPSICASRSISASLPTTGSRPPLRAISVRSVPKRSSIFALLSSACCAPDSSSNSPDVISISAAPCMRLSVEMPIFCHIWLSGIRLSLRMASSRWSEVGKADPESSISAKSLLNITSDSGERVIFSSRFVSCEGLVSAGLSASSSSFSRERLTLWLCSNSQALFSLCLIMPRSR